MQVEIIGRQSISHIEEILSEKKIKKILFFRGQKSFDNLKDKILPFLKKCQIDYVKDFDTNPKFNQIQNVVEKYRDSNYDMIIAFGGGSVIDFAKAFKYYSKIITPLLAIPTTAGSGSEATQFAVVYLNDEKISLDSNLILPEYTIIDSQFCENTSTKIKAACAMDAYCQAIESFWAKKATKESQRYALQAIKICRRSLVTFVTTNSVFAAEELSKASHLAGKAINISRTTAAHALSYKMTSLYGIPHGHAVALSIANLFLKNLQYFDYPQLLDAMEIKSSDIKEYFHNLMKTIGLNDNFETLGVFDKNLIIDSVNIERLNNNPVSLTKHDLIEILEK